MAILNVTPDSFSDGGLHQPTDIDALKETVSAQIAAGATIIDVGGQSSRPNAPDVTPEEEIARVLPAIEAIKSLPEAAHVAISVDTYRAVVAEAAVSAGAHIVNDISAGLLDPEMLPTIARLGCTYIMMHMRGTPADMQSDQHTSYDMTQFESEIADELKERVLAAQAAGIRRWRIILDPGLGFAKTASQSARLLGGLRSVRTSCPVQPWLVGPSRKSFIGLYTGTEDPKDRVMGTAVAVTAAIANFASIVRVHDVKEMAQVTKLADAIYGTSRSGL
jgi:2-amino-4-hydroxy-6-hydroxymethyldihydropteridine diphosphokinase/dihydropteroate synthase